MATKTRALTQEERFAREMARFPDDHSVRMVFADWLQEVKGWSNERVAPLRDGRLTGRRPYPTRWCWSWGDYKAAWNDYSDLPGDIYKIMRSLVNRSKNEDEMAYDSIKYPDPSDDGGSDGVSPWSFVKVKTEKRAWTYYIRTIVAWARS